MTFGKTVLILATGAIPLLMGSYAVMAGSTIGYVTAYSQYGNGTVRAPVRAAQFGRQVKLPGGPWLYCEKSGLLFGRNRPCSETLRRETIDYWETRADEQGGNS